MTPAPLAPQPPIGANFRRPADRAQTIGATIVVLAVITMSFAGLGTRWGWWTFRTGFTLLAWGAYAAIGGAVLAAVAALLIPAYRRRGALLRTVPVVVIALATVAVPWQARRTARQVPAIHDITTDTQNPPEFVALHDRRPGARNPVEYGGREVAAKQRAGYPDLGPLDVDKPPAQVVAQSAAVARDLGWKIVAVDTAAGRVEATDRTLWFGFYDDVVVRVTPATGGSRVDVRSLSRVGRSDVGTNARRIRAFLARMQRAG